MRGAGSFEVLCGAVEFLNCCVARRKRVKNYEKARKNAEKLGKTGVTTG